MKRRNWVIGLFVILAITQAVTALYLVWNWENILQTGQSYRWQTAPIDPYDALRGRYVSFSFKEMKAPLRGTTQPLPGQRAYGIVGRDEKGYATIEGVQVECPQTGDYVRLKVIQVESDYISVALPFNRFYLDEALAPEVEKAYRSAAGQVAFVVVRLKNGDAVVEDLYIENMPLRDYLQR